MVFALDGPTPMLTSVMPLPSLGGEVVGGHLVAPPRAEFHPLLVLRVATLDPNAARRDELVIALAGTQLGEAQLDELVHVAVVVREEDVLLKVRRIGPGVVLQPLQRVVRPQRAEERERTRRRRSADDGGGSPVAVRHPVVQPGEVGRREEPGKGGWGDALRVEALSVLQNERVGDLNIRRPNRQRNLVAFDKQSKLLGEVVGKEPGLGDVALVAARRRELAECG